MEKTYYFNETEFQVEHLPNGNMIIKLAQWTAIVGSNHESDNPAKAYAYGLINNPNQPDPLWDIHGAAAQPEEAVNLACHMLLQQQDRWKGEQFRAQHIRQWYDNLDNHTTDTGCA